MVKQLVALDADFIALQECFHTEDENYNTALSLASALGMDCRLLSYRQKQRRIEAAVQDSYSGLAILSKEPAQAEQHLSLPSVEEDGERDGLLCTFSVNDMEIALANLHLSHLRTADELRVNQLKIALELIKKTQRNAHCSIGHDVWIGHGAIIMPGVTVGTGAVIGAGAVVTKDIAPYEIAVGVPGRPIRKRFDDATIEKLLSIAWWDWDRLTIEARFDELRDVGSFVDKYS